MKIPVLSLRAESRSVLHVERIQAPFDSAQGDIGVTSELFASYQDQQKQ